MLTTEVTQALCAGDNSATISMTVGGGAIGTVEVLWQDTGTSADFRDNLAPGIYQYRISDSQGCVVTGSVIITEPPPLAFENVEPIFTSCYDSKDGGISLNITGGTGAYRYVLNGQTVPITGDFLEIRNLGRGSYEGMVLDENNCQIALPIVVPAPPLLEPDLQSLIVTPSCPQIATGAISLEALGGTPDYRFTWDPNSNQSGNFVNELSKGDYTVTITDDNAALAEESADGLLDFAWAEREKFVYHVTPLAESMAAAQAAAEAPGDGPVIILDHYDNTASGGTMDTTEVLRAVLDAGLEDVAVFGFYDPEVVQQMIAAGVGSEVTVHLGGKLPMPALAEQSAPITLTGEVKLLSNGKFKARVAMARGLTINMGPSAVLSVGGVDIAVISRHMEPYDPECFRCLGMEPTQRRYLMLKSRIHYRVGFKPIAKEIVECAGRGVCTSDYGEVTFENVRRPIYPLDAEPGSNVDRREFSRGSI